MEHTNNDTYFTSYEDLDIVCGPQLEFFELSSRWPGGMAANKIFTISEINQRFEYNQLDGRLLANNHYGLRHFLMTPIEQPHTVNEFRYNAAHNRTNVIPQAIDLWKRRFRCLQTVLNNKEDTVQSIISACAVLHNFAIQRNIPLPPNVVRTKIEMPVRVKNLPSDVGDANQYSSMTIFVCPEAMELIEREQFVQEHFSDDCL